MEGIGGVKMNSVSLISESDMEGWIAVEEEEERTEDGEETFEEIYEKLKNFLVMRK